MSLKIPEILKMPRAIGFRLTLWYSSIFLISSLIIFGIAYVLLTSAIEDDNRGIIEDELNEYNLAYKIEGWRGIIDKIRLEQAKDKASTFFVRIADAKNKTLFLNIPRPYNTLYNTLKDEIEKNIPQNKKGWLFIKLRLKSEGEEDTIETAYSRLADGTIIEVGRSLDAKEDLLEEFQIIFACIIASTVMLSLIGGGFLAFRTLRPIRDLISTVKTIGSGKISARVPSRNTGDELDELIRLFNEMLKKIETLVNGMKEALDNVAHDLRTPITRIRAVIETTLAADNDKERLREALMDCAEEAERISSMLNTLMDISEAETGTLRLRFEDSDVGRIIKDIAELYQYVAETKGISISVTAPKGLLARIDPNRFRQAIANLLDNAIKYTEKGGSVFINADKTETGKELIISVKDTGAGITQNDLPRIFDRLFRADKSRSQRGLGLGLSLVRAVIHAHRGRIEVKSTPEKGSTFIIFIPAGEGPIISGASGDLA
ncbi:sensor histidine kinase [Dissulfurimicrobium hydrothermale]|uniref:sensor histidine kinase n=1 Tax=Dissulfurimicrobium hydrothermale TaxID=1750598 RepID=UPI001EDC1250|nr:HAMP domain-containing sensor histidine kinase [Dissulfurimicrobium hydrothermale]UKL13056.1 HAMP domain-containing histidine kinase [Dissulfurimicrobium hydrothermale]